jgi:predicted Zn-dependent peptidase
MFDKHPYKNSVIGTMEDLDAAELDEFKAFFDKYYNPNNATLVVAGDIDVPKTKKMIADYFQSIPSGDEVERVNISEDPIEDKIIATEYDSNIQIPLTALVYRTPSMKDREAYVLNMISSVLTDGKSSRMYKRMVDEDKIALQVLAFARSQEDYGTYLIGALPLGDVELSKLRDVMDEEIEKLQTELITEREYQKLQNKFENQFVNSNSSIQGIASSLATYQMLYGNTNLINEEIEIYRSITREEIKEVANKYLQENQRLELDYLPEPTE